jgi:hypothetical protein
VSRRIGVEGRHDAPAPKVMDANHNVTDEKLIPLPFSLLQAGDASNNDVRPKSPPVAPKLRNRAIRRGQEREYVGVRISSSTNGIHSYWRGRAGHISAR